MEMSFLIAIIEGRYAKLSAFLLKNSKIYCSKERSRIRRKKKMKLELFRLLIVKDISSQFWTKMGNFRARKGYPLSYLDGENEVLSLSLLVLLERLFS